MGMQDEKRSSADRRRTRGVDDRGRFRLDEPFEPRAGEIQRPALGPLLPYAGLLLALQRQDEARELARRRTDIVASMPARSERATSQAEWRRLWEDMEREASAPRRGHEAGGDDPTSPDANPEIAEWERHWPSSSEGAYGVGVGGDGDGDAALFQGPSHEGSERRRGLIRAWLARIFSALFRWLARA